jgi:dTDP-4-dehydrorhamnose 3,5-epimerase
MKIIPTAIPEVVVLEPRVFEDPRGFLMETYHRRQFAELGVTAEFVQDNHSRSTRGVLRGLHYQIEHPQGKLCRVVRGEIFDVAVDLRRSAATFGHWVGVSLSEQNRRQLYVPAGFAHGFVVLSEVAELLYKCTEFYSPQHERTIRWDDPELGIDWPVREPLLAPKDANGVAFHAADCFD